jgi:hypothetical protein
VDEDRDERTWRRERLKAPQKQKGRERLWLDDGSCARLRPEHANHVWILLLRKTPGKVEPSTGLTFS